MGFGLYGSRFSVMVEGTRFKFRLDSKEGVRCKGGEEQVKDISVYAFRVSDLVIR